MHEIDFTLSDGRVVKLGIDTLHFDPRVRTYGGDFMKIRRRDGTYFVRHDHSESEDAGIVVRVPDGLEFHLVYGRPTYESEVVTDQIEFGDETDHPLLYYNIERAGDMHIIEFRAAIAAPGMYVRMEFKET